jgi:hypothetical protein
MGLMRGNANDRYGWGAGEGDGYDEGERGQRAEQDISLLVSSSFRMAQLVIPPFETRERRPELQRAEPSPHG